MVGNLNMSSNNMNGHFLNITENISLTQHKTLQTLFQQLSQPNPSQFMPHNGNTNGLSLPTPMPSPETPLLIKEASPVNQIIKQPFGSIAGALGVLSSNSTLQTSQFLSTCAPLLQLGVKQAIQECFPNIVRISLRGELEVSVEFPEKNTKSSTLLHFIDNTESSDIPIVMNSPEKLNVKMDDKDSHAVPSIQCPLTALHSVTNHCTIGSARRKSMNPSKYNIQEEEIQQYTQSDNLAYHQKLIPSPNTTSSPYGMSPNSVSPGTESALDLSRAASTPMKYLHLNSPIPNTTVPVPTIQTNGTQCITVNHSMDDHQRLQRDLFNNRLQQANTLGMWEHLRVVWNRLMNNNVMPQNNPATIAPLGLVTSNNETMTNQNNQSRIRRVRQRTRSRLHSQRKSTSVRSFPCNQCDVHSQSLTDLEQHTMSTHGSYKCHVCDAKFTQRSNLQRHALKHVGFKPFQCRVCQKAYYRKDHLMRHMEMMHPDCDARDNIIVLLTSSESLEYLNRQNTDAEQTTNDRPMSEPTEDIVMSAEDTSERVSLVSPIKEEGEATST